MSRVHTLGEMVAIDAPAELADALFTVAHIHYEFDKIATLRGISRTHCIQCSLAVRDFLIRRGFEASVRSVANIAVTPTGKDTMGLPNERTNEWSGHLVTVTSDYLIDTTLYHLRPTWRGPRGMICVPLLDTVQQHINGMPVIATINGSGFQMAWLDRPENTSWTETKSAKDGAVIEKIVTALLAVRRNEEKPQPPEGDCG